MAMSTAFLVVLLVGMEYSAMVSLASLADVNINNEIQDANAVIVGCVKRDNGHHLQVQTLWYGQHYGWGFTPNVNGTTRYYCDFRWGARYQRVLVWDDVPFFPSPGDTTFRPCTHCLWRVTREGFYRTTTDPNKPLSVFIGGWR
jgi:hypothetical protein